MAFAGVGGSANLGSATGFLFINASGVDKGLKDAASAITKFDATSQAAAQATADLAAAASNLAAKQAELRSATASHAADLTNQSAKQRELSKAQAEYNKFATETKRVEDNLTQARNQSSAAASKVQKAQERLVNAANAVTAAQQVAIKAGTASQDIALRSAKIDADRAKEAQTLAKIQAQAARTNVLAHKEELATLKEAGAANSVIAAKQAEVAQATKLNREAQLQLSETNVRVTSTQRALTLAEEEYARAEKAAIASIDVRIVKEHEKALAELESAKIAQDAAQINVRNQEINLRTARQNEDVARSALETAKAEELSARQQVAASEKIVAAKEKEVIAARKAHTEIAASSAQLSTQLVADAEASTAKSVAAFGRLATTIGGGLLIATAAATAVFTSFDEEMANVAAISPDLNAQFDEMKSHVLDLSTQFGKSANDIARGLFTIAQAGVPADKVVGVLDLAVKASVAGRSTVEEAVRPLIGIINAYSLSVEQAAKEMDVLFQAAQDGVFDFKDLSTNLGKNLSIASQLGVTIPELAASYVVLTKRSNSLAESTVQINAIMNSFLKPSEDLTAVVEQYTGQTAEAFFATHDFADVLLLVEQIFEQQGQEIAGHLFPNLRAIKGIYGLTAGEVKALREETIRLRAEEITGGATAQVLARQQQAAAFQFRQTREEIRKAAILIGQDAAPAFLNLARVVRQGVQAFNDLSPAMRSVAVNIAVFGGASLLALGVIIRIVTSIAGIAAGARAAALALARFAEVLAKFGPLAIPLAGLAALIEPIVNQHLKAADAARKQADAMRELNSAVQTFEQLVVQLRLDNFTDAADAVEGLTADLESGVHFLEEAANAAANGETGFGRYTRVIEAAGGSSVKLRDAAKALEDQLIVMQQALTVAGVDTASLARDFDVLVEQLLAGDITGEEFTAKIKDIIKHLDKYAKAADDVIPPLKDLEEESKSLFQSADDAAKAFDDTLKNLITTSLAANSKFGNLANPLETINKLLNITGKSAFRTFLDLEKIGFVHFTGPEREALRVADALQRTEDRLVRVDAAIQNNEEDMAMWQGRIDLVDNVLGDHNDTMQEYIDKLNSGEISTEEFNNAVADGTAHRAFKDLVDLYNDGTIDAKTYNQALEDGTFIIERSTGGIKDERVEQLKELHALRLAIEAHDKANGKYKELTDTQRAFIGALKDQNVQQTLALASLLAMLEAMGQVPPGTTTKFLADASQANPVLAVLLDQLDIFDGKHEADLSLKGAEGVISQLNHVKGVTERATGDKAITIHINSRNADPKLKEFLDLNGQTLADAGIDVTFEINGKKYGPNDPDNPLTQFKNDQQAIENKKKVHAEVAVDVVDTGNFPSQGAGRGGPVGAIQAVGDAADDVDGKKAEVDTDAPGAQQAQTDLDNTKTAADAVPDKVDTDVEVTGLDEARKSMTEFETDLADFVTRVAKLSKEAGNGFASWFPIGVREQANVAAQAATNELIISLQGTMNGIFNQAWFTGRFFDAGFVAGIGSALDQVFAAGHAAGQSAINGANSAIKPGSPSKVTQLLGASFVDGLIVGIRAGTTRTQQAARDLANSTTQAFQQQFKLKDQAQFHADAVTRDAAAFGQQVQRMSFTPGGVGHTFNLAPSITVNGSTTNEQTAEVIWRRLEDGLIQFAAQTGAGS